MIAIGALFAACPGGNGNDDLADTPAIDSAPVSDSRTDSRDAIDSSASVVDGEVAAGIDAALDAIGVPDEDTGSDAVVEPDTSAQLDILTQPDADAEPDADASQDAVPDAVSVPHVDAAPDIGGESDEGVGTDTELDAVLESDEVAPPDAVTRPDVVSGPDLIVDSGAATDIVTEPDDASEPDAVADAVTETDAVPEPDVVTEPDAMADVNSVTDSGADTDSDAADSGPGDTLPPVFGGVVSAAALSTTEILITWEQAWDDLSPVDAIVYEICVSEARVDKGGCQPFVADDESPAGVDPPLSMGERGAKT